MFESLTASLSSAINALRGRGKLTDANMREGLSGVRTALLEADVAYDVVDSFLSRVVADATGARVLESLDPAQQLVGIVHRELVDLMGPVDHSLHLQPGTTTILMLCGLQGSGKTTSCGKLAKRIKQQGAGVMLVAADLQRPAAIEQLAVLGRQIGVPVHVPDGQTDPVAVCNAGVARAKKEGISVVILDTAGRLSIDEALMQELARIDRTVGPDQVYLVVDAMTGQDAVRSAKAFNDALELDGVIMTKLDGDARGGAALSVKSVTGVPIKFVGTGERFDALEEFHADRAAGRILGMGDVVSLVEKAQAEVNEEEAEEAAAKMAKGQFTLQDFLKQMRMIRRMGPMKQILGLLPGVGGMLKDVDIDERQIDRMEAIILSMTPRERDRVGIIDRSRQKRIAAGSGAKLDDVSRLVKQFEMMQKMTQQMAGMGAMGKARAMQELSRAGAGPGGMPAFPMRGSTVTESPKARFKQRKKR